MERGAKELERQKTIPFSDLFTDSFMRKYTNYLTFDELMKAGRFQAKTTEEFQAIPDDSFNTHIAATTKFKTWEDMLGEATSQYVTKKLGL